MSSPATTPAVAVDAPVEVPINTPAAAEAVPAAAATETKQEAADAPAEAAATETKPEAAASTAETVLGKRAHEDEGLSDGDGDDDLSGDEDDLSDDDDDDVDLPAAKRPRFGVYDRSELLRQLHIALENATFLRGLAENNHHLVRMEVFLSLEGAYDAARVAAWLGEVHASEHEDLTRGQLASLYTAMELAHRAARA